MNAVKDLTISKVKGQHHVHSDEPVAVANEIRKWFLKKVNCRIFQSIVCTNENDSAYRFTYAHIQFPADLKPAAKL
jgi:hypothetical protein